MKPAHVPPKNQTHDPRMWVELYDRYLRHFALSRINNAEIAKDLVQDTFLAALASLENFQRRSSVKTWLTGILRNKIVDYYRACQRERAVADFDFEGIAVDKMSGGHNQWSLWTNRLDLNPAACFEQMEFFEVFGRCLAGLPMRLAYIFILHAFVGLSTDEICEALNISKTNCWVMLHRARKLLRLALQARWISA
jgi:RNA polymerase sigma-70 factor (TIGR02943 family)